MQEMEETRVRSLDWEDPLEEGMATHSSILAWRIPWTEEPGRLQSMGLQRVGYNRVTEYTYDSIYMNIYIYIHEALNIWHILCILRFFRNKD